MRLRTEVPPFRRFVDDTRRGMAVDVQAKVEAGGRGFQLTLRQQTFRAGLGERLGNAIRLRVYPGRGRASLGAAALVYPSGEGAREIFDGFHRSSPIRGKDGSTWLALPTKNAPRMGLRRKVTPAMVEAYYGRALRVVPPGIARPGSKVGLLVMDRASHSPMGSKNRSFRRSTRGAVMFILVPEIHLGRRLDFDAAARLWAARIPNL